jgi:hypothetical protein
VATGLTAEMPSSPILQAMLTYPALYKSKPNLKCEQFSDHGECGLPEAQLDRQRWVHH